MFAPSRLVWRGLIPCVALLVGAPAQAIVPGTATNDFPCVVPILDDNDVFVGTGVFVGKRKLITADHVRGNRIKIGLTTHRGTRVSAPTSGGSSADLAVLCFDEDIAGEFYTIDADPVTPGSSICLVGYGPSSKSGSSPYDITPDPNPVKREAKNVVDTTTEIESDDGPKRYKDQTYCFDFDAPGSGVPNEGITTPNDSGGALFVIGPNNTKRFVGMLLAGEVDTTAEYGMNSYATQLRVHKAWIESVPEPGSLVALSVGLGFVIARRRR